MLNGATPLTNGILKLIDGVPFAVDGYMIWNMMRIRYGIKRVQFGVIDKETQKLDGLYSFDNKRHTLHSLSKLEISCDENTAFNECFILVKADVLEILLPFKDQIRGAKKFLYKLVQEFCQKRRRGRSFLLQWASVEPGTEFAAFDKTMQNFKDLDDFCGDLTQFLKDVIDSCPKGWQQFLELSKPKK